MQDPKALIKDTLLFLVCGVVIQFILYKSVGMCIESEQIVPATILVLALFTNSLIFFTGCVRKSLILFEEIENTRKGK